MQHEMLNRLRMLEGSLEEHRQMRQNMQETLQAIMNRSRPLQKGDLGHADDSIGMFATQFRSMFDKMYASSKRGIDTEHAGILARGTKSSVQYKARSNVKDPNFPSLNEIRRFVPDDVIKQLRAVMNDVPNIDAALHAANEKGHMYLLEGNKSLQAVDNCARPVVTTFDLQRKWLHREMDRCKHDIHDLQEAFKQPGKQAGEQTEQTGEQEKSLTLQVAKEDASEYLRQEQRDVYVENKQRLDDLVRKVQNNSSNSEHKGEKTKVVAGENEAAEKTKVVAGEDKAAEEEVKPKEATGLRALLTLLKQTFGTRAVLILALAIIGYYYKPQLDSYFKKEGAPLIATQIPNISEPSRVLAGMTAQLVAVGIMALLILWCFLGSRAEEIEESYMLRQIQSNLGEYWDPGSD